MTYDYEAIVARRRAAAAVMRICPLRSERVRGIAPGLCARARLCFLCGTPLPPRRRRWCSDPCWNIWARNHTWSTASFFAGFRARLPLLTAMASFDVWGRLLRVDDVVRIADALAPQCERCGRRGFVEINHVVPRVGAGYEENCAHHQTNLEPLCHDCHVAETVRQRRERGRPVIGTEPLLLWGAAS